MMTLIVDHTAYDQVISDLVTVRRTMLIPARIETWASGEMTKLVELWAIKAIMASRLTQKVFDEMMVLVASFMGCFLREVINNSTPVAGGGWLMADRPGE